MAKLLTPRSAEDYGKALAALLPRGRAFTHEPSSNLRKLLNALASPLADLDKSITTTANEASPSYATLSGLLERWEQVFNVDHSGRTEAFRRTWLTIKIGLGNRNSAADIKAIARLYGLELRLQQHDWFLAKRQWNSGDGYWLGLLIANSQNSFARASQAKAGQLLRAANPDTIAFEDDLRRRIQANVAIIYEYRR